MGKFTEVINGRIRAAMVTGLLALVLLLGTLADAVSAAQTCGPIDGATYLGTQEWTFEGFLDSETLCGWQRVTWQVATYRLEDGQLINLKCSESAEAINPPVR